MIFWSLEMHPKCKQFFSFAFQRLNSQVQIALKYLKYHSCQQHKHCGTSQDQKWNNDGINQIPYHKYKKYSDACLSKVKLRRQSRQEERPSRIKTRYLLRIIGRSYSNESATNPHQTTKILSLQGIIHIHTLFRSRKQQTIHHH